MNCMIGRKIAMFWMVLAMGLGCASLSWADAGATLKPGDIFPDAALRTPADQTDREYLGLSGADEFKISQIPAQVILIEIVGVYCPVCHKQFPNMRKLFFTINKDETLAKNVRILAVAAGAAEAETAYLKKQTQLPYPVVVDPDFRIHKLLGEPRTPFTLLLDANRKILSAHQGLITDFDAFLNQIRTAASSP